MPAGERPLPALDRAVRVWDSRAGRPLELGALFDRLAEADVVFVGETHLDDTTHRFELAVLEEIATRRSGGVVLSLEMFERDVQPVLDDYLAGRIDEAAFLAAARPWGNYRTDYRPLVEAARSAGIPVVAANAPAALRRKLSAGGREALQALPPEERAWLPDDILPAQASYWERVDRATRGHMGFASLPEEKRLFTGQNLWDNCMGDACARSLREHPDATIVHVVGGFHVMYGDGTVAQLRARAPRARVAVVEVLPVADLAAARPRRDAARADFLVYAAARARSESDGSLAVAMPTELRFTLDVPSTAGEGAPAPLLVWLPDSSERPEDARALLRACLGGEAAIAVVEPPVHDRAPDLAPSGRWSRPEAFRADHAAVLAGLERLVEYASRRLPVSGQGVVVAGSGRGATAALATALGTEWLDARFVAVRPAGAEALRMEGLPDQPPLTREVRVLVAPGAEDEGGWIVDDFRTLGTAAELRTLDGAERESLQVEDVLRDALGLPARPRLDGDETVACVIERDLPRARSWAEIRARQIEREGRPARVVLPEELGGDEDPALVQRLAIGEEWSIESFGEGRGLPLAPGDFGGTTVLVVPAVADAAERAAWRELEAAKPLRKVSFFAGLRVAFEDEAPGLADVVAELRAGGTRSVLVVPAVFCASPAEMRTLADAVAVAGAAGDLDLAWLPGLGAALCAGSAEE